MGVVYMISAHNGELAFHKMDDPLIGLAVWQSQETEKKKNNKREPASSRQGKATKGKQGRPDSNKLMENREERGTSENRFPENSIESSDNCFPCLPSLDIPKSKMEDNTEQIATERLKATENEKEEEEAGRNLKLESLSISPMPQLENFWLLRLFESNLFTMHIAVQYLYNERDPVVQMYLGKKLFVSN